MADVSNVPYTLKLAFAANNEQAIEAVESGTGNVQSLDETLDTAGAHTIAATFDHTKVLAIHIQTDKALTSITFTGTTGPVATPAIAAGNGWAWSSANRADPFGANCTSIAIVTAAINTRVKIRIVQSP